MNRKFFALKMGITIIVSMILSCTSSRPGGYQYTSAKASSAGVGFYTLPPAPDKAYGYEQKNPVKVGGYAKNEGALNAHKFLNSLRNPTGGDIVYARSGICCPFSTPTAPGGSGHLDMYIITWDGLKKPLTIYVNSYEEGPLYVPKGLMTAPAPTPAP